MATGRLNTRLALIHFGTAVRVNGARQARRYAERSQYRDRDKQSFQRMMPKKPYHGQRGKRHNSQENKKIRPRVR